MDVNLRRFWKRMSKRRLVPLLLMLLVAWVLVEGLWRVSSSLLDATSSSLSETLVDNNIHHDPPSYLTSNTDPFTGALSPLGHAPRRGGGGNVSLDKSAELDGRAALVKQRCAKYGASIGSFTCYGCMFVNQERRLLMCGTPKVSISVWHLLMLQLAGLANSDSLKLLYKKGQGIDAVEARAREKMNLLPPEERNKRYDRRSLQKVNKMFAKDSSYFKFKWTEVRHPFERLLSCYRDKIIQRPMAPYIKKLRQMRSLRQQKQQGNRAPVPAAHPGNAHLDKAEFSFSEFVDMVIQGLSNAPGGYKEDHFVPHSMLCNPCSVPYDYIIKFETVHAEANHVLARGNLSHLIKFPGNERDSTKSSKSVLKGPATNTLLASYFATLSDDQIRALYEVYKIDFLLYGYVEEDYVLAPHKN